MALGVTVRWGWYHDVQCQWIVFGEQGAREGEQRAWGWGCVGVWRRIHAKIQFWYSTCNFDMQHAILLFYILFWYAKPTFFISFCNAIFDCAIPNSILICWMVFCNHDYAKRNYGEPNYAVPYYAIPIYATSWRHQSTVAHKLIFASIKFSSPSIISHLENVSAPGWEI